MPGLSQAALSFQHAGHLDKGKGFGKAKEKGKLQKINWEKSADDNILSFCYAAPVLNISLALLPTVLFCSN